MSNVEPYYGAYRQVVAPVTLHYFCFEMGRSLIDRKKHVLYADLHVVARLVEGFSPLPERNHRVVPRCVATTAKTSIASTAAPLGTGIFPNTFFTWRYAKGLNDSTPYTLFSSESDLYTPVRPSLSYTPTSL